MLKEFKTGFLLVICMMIMLGLIYPSFVTILAQIIFPWQANGSMIEKNGSIVGSFLIGQSFTDPNYFWGRPSATVSFSYNAANSSGSNLGPSNPILFENIENRIRVLQQTSFQSTQSIPVDLVTSSASGLDPEISPLAAYYQIPRIAKIRNMSERKIEELVKKSIQYRTFGFLGEPRVNVLQLNMALDNL